MTRFVDRKNEAVFGTGGYGSYGGWLMSGGLVGCVCVFFFFRVWGWLILKTALVIYRGL